MISAGAIGCSAVNVGLAALLAASATPPLRASVVLSRSVAENAPLSPVGMRTVPRVKGRPVAAVGRCRGRPMFCAGDTNGGVSFCKSARADF